MNKIYISIILIVSTAFLVFPFIAYFGNEVMVVKSDSMVPTLQPNDLIIIEKINIEKVNIGDIIVFDSHMEGIGIIAHRAIEKFTEDNAVGIDTKGDNIDESDPWIVHEEDFLGRVIEIIPGFGILLVAPIRYSLTIIIIITSIVLFKEIINEQKIQKGK